MSTDLKRIMLINLAKRLCKMSSVDIAFALVVTATSLPVLTKLTLLCWINFFNFLPSAEYIFLLDYLTVILPRWLLSTATAGYSTHPLDVDFCRQPHSTPYVDYCKCLWLIKTSSCGRKRLAFTHSEPFNEMFTFNSKSRYCNGTFTDFQFTLLLAKRF